jgi:hypothetical protein
MKKVLILLFLSSGGWVFSQGALGEIIGTVVDLKSNEAIIEARVWVEDNGKKYQAKTDLDGRFRISAIPAGTYNVNVYYLEDTLKGIPVDVPMEGFGNTGIIRFGTSQDLQVVDVTAEYQKLKNAINSTPVYSMNFKDIAKSAQKFSIKGMVTSMTSEVRIADDGELMFKGARKGDMLYIQDGMKARSMDQLPSCAIGNIMVYTGGLPAKYGDTLGGVVVLETKSYFDLLRERGN